MNPLGKLILDVTGRGWKAYRPMDVRYDFEAKPNADDPWLDGFTAHPRRPEFPWSYAGLSRDEAGGVVAHFAKPEAKLVGERLVYATEAVPEAKLRADARQAEDAASAAIPLDRLPEGRRRLEAAQERAAQFARILTQIDNFKAAQATHAPAAPRPGVSP